jgi:hypothetical protein
MPWPWTRKKQNNNLQAINAKLQAIINEEKTKKAKRNANKRKRAQTNALRKAERRLQQIEIINSGNINYARKKHPNLLSRYGLTNYPIQGLPFGQWMNFQRNLRSRKKANANEEARRIQEENEASERAFQERERKLREFVEEERRASDPKAINSRPPSPFGGGKTRKRKH